jgi:SAM-dependent methyltransferase
MENPTSNPRNNVMNDPQYKPQVFNVASAEAAKRIILTPEGGSSTDERWAKETPYLAGEFIDALAISDTSVLVDYGCGIGRLSKELIDRTGCTVVGVDISASMLALAHVYVGSARFIGCAPAGLRRLVDNGFRADAAYSVWVLQHCLTPADDIALIGDAVIETAPLCVVNSINRLVPTDHGWVSDGDDIVEHLTRRFDAVEDRPLKLGPVQEAVQTSSYFKVFNKSGS